jgi:hypothetical protein
VGELEGEMRSRRKRVRIKIALKAGDFGAVLRQALKIYLCRHVLVGESGFIDSK